MHVTDVYPPAPKSPQPADWSDVQDLQRKLMVETGELCAMAGDMGRARQIREFNADQRKRCLAVAALPLLKAGASAAAAELEARASEPYAAALKQLAKDLTAAEQTIAAYEGHRLAWESARSLLSMMKTQVGQI